MNKRLLTFVVTGTALALGTLAPSVNAQDIDSQISTANSQIQNLNNQKQAVASQVEQNLATWLVDLGIEPSRRQSREDIQNGAISINGEKITDLEHIWTPEQSFEGRFVLVRRGKKKYFLVKLK